MRSGLFITGTDTDVGKTVVTTGLVRFLNASGLLTYGVKPVCCGGTEDLEAIRAANPTELPSENLNPVYLNQPAAPLSIDAAIPPLSQVVSQFDEIETDLLVVEGAGGWMVPVCAEWDMERLAQRLSLPVILVVANKLGALNHALLSAQAIENAGLSLAGFYLNNLEITDYPHAQATNREILAQLLPCPCLGEIPIGGGELDGAPLLQALGLVSTGEQEISIKL